MPEIQRRSRFGQRKRRDSLPYAREGATWLIEVRLNDVQQLYNTLDPAPSREKELDLHVDRYIFESAQELPPAALIKLVLHFPPHAQDSITDTIAESIHNHFGYRAHGALMELRQILRNGRISLAIGVLFLFACLTARAVLDARGKGTLAEIAQEGLLIMGWVAMWRPIQIFLYDWWPIQRKRRILERLIAIPVELRFGAPPPVRPGP